MADGSLKFDTKIDTDGFEKGTNTLKGMMERTVSAIKRVGNGVADAFSETGNIDATNVKIKALVDEIDQYRDSLYYLEKQGLYFGDAEYDEAYRKLSRLENELNSYKKSLTDVDNQQKKASNSTKRLGKEVDKTNKKSKKYNKTLQLLKMSLLFSITFRALSASMKAIGEGFQNLAQYSKQTNKDISALKTSLQTLKNSFGTAFAPVLTAITPALQTLINYLSQAITTMGQFFAVLFTGATTFTKAKDAQVDYAASLKKSAKEAKKSVASFDELNIISNNKGAGGYEAPSPKQMFEDVAIDSKLIDKANEFKETLEPVADAFDRLKESVAPFAENVGTGLKWMYDNVLVPLASWTITNLLPSYLDLLGAAIGVLNSVIMVFQPYAIWLWDNFLLPIAQWTGNAIIDGLKLLTQGLNNLSNWISSNQGSIINAAIAIGSFFAAFKIAEFMVAIAPFVSTLAGMISSGTILSSVLAGIGSILSTILSPVTVITAVLGMLIYTFIDLYNNSESFRQSIVNLGQTWFSALQPLAEFVGTVLADAWDKILRPIVEFFVNTLIPSLVDVFKNLWENILVPLANFIGTYLSPVFQILSDILSMLWTNVILPLADAIGTVLSEAWKTLCDILNISIIPVIETVIEVLTYLWENVINPIISVLWDSFKPAFETVFSAIGGIIEGLKTTLSGVIDFIKGVFTGDWDKAWKGIQDIFKGIWDALVDIVRTPINLIIDIINGLIKGIVAGVNTVINAINSINFTVPDWVPGIGGKSIGFSLKAITAPQIPKLATGTVVPANYGEFLAILGDNKRETEVVSPLSTIKQALVEALTETGGNGKQEIILKFEGSLSELARILKPALESEDDRVGIKLVTGGA